MSLTGQGLARAQPSDRGHRQRGDQGRTVREAGGEAWLTSPLHKTGSDRVAEVAAGLSEELILNLQGDEPLVPLSTLASLVEFGQRCPELTVATPMIPLRDEADILNPNIVKVVAARNGRALYFSRHAIPYVKPALAGALLPQTGPEWRSRATSSTWESTFTAASSCSGS